MKELKLLGLLATGAALAFAALYWGIGSPWNELMALLGGLLYGIAIGIYYGIDLLYRHVEGRRPSSATTSDILGRIL